MARVLLAQVPVDGKSYCGLPEGQRTTFVAGALDMLSLASLYISSEDREGNEAVRAYAAKYLNGALRIKVDAYVNADAGRLKEETSQLVLEALAQGRKDDHY